MQEFLNTTWFEIGRMAFTYGQIIYSIGFVLICYVIYWYLSALGIPRFVQRTDDSAGYKARLRRILSYILYLALLSGLLLILGLDRTLYTNDHIDIRVTTVIHALLIFQIARMIDRLISHAVIQRYYEQRDKPKADSPVLEGRQEEKASKTAQIAVYVLALILILTGFQLNYEFPIYETNEGVQIFLRISDILLAVLVLLLARLAVWVLTQLVLYGYYKRAKVDPGSQFAFNQLLKYVVYVFAILIAINLMGVKGTLVWGGLAALLVGVGLGLQQTFNDFFSGIILLFERSVQIGDVLEVDGMIGAVRKIGMRASMIETRENVAVVVPNSKLVTQNVINWSSFDAKVRFNISVQVAYGSDTKKVKEILLQVSKESPYIVDVPAPFVRMVDFADSGIVFELHFWSGHYIIIEDVKSDLRFKIDQKFTEEGVVIPFPQRDLWIRGNEKKNPPEEIS